MMIYKAETTEELIDKACTDLAANLKELNKFDGNAAWDRIHKLGRLIENTATYIRMYRQREES